MAPQFTPTQSLGGPWCLGPLGLGQHEVTSFFWPGVLELPGIDILYVCPRSRCSQGDPFLTQLFPPSFLLSKNLHSTSVILGTEKDPGRQRTFLSLFHPQFFLGTEELASPRLENGIWSGLQYQQLLKPFPWGEAAVRVCEGRELGGQGGPLTSVSFLEHRSVGCKAAQPEPLWRTVSGHQLRRLPLCKAHECLINIY